ncbi:MAG: sporulation initiation factor Spo0A C-terminal domain-containing protein [Clostridia bacterium]|nr:sporulation initiation factor Spo0A C-terminal domain-containing protein [Clostridia bacterium]
MKDDREKKACLLLRSQDRARAEAYLRGRNVTVTDRLEGAGFLLAEEDLLLGSGAGLADRCRQLGVPLFLLAERNDGLAASESGAQRDVLAAATFVFFKPLVLELALRRIALLLGEDADEGGRRGWFTLQAQCSLDALNVPRHLLAFRYFSDGVGLLSELRYPSRIKLMQQLYPALSQRYNSSPVMVDRAMRHGVESCWRLAGKGVQRQYFGYSAQDKQGMPTNGEFLFALYEHVKLLLPYDRGQADFFRELSRINGREMGSNGCQSAQDLIY